MGAHHELADSPMVLPAQRREGFSRFFTWYTARLFRKRFHAVRVALDSQQLLNDAARAPGPLIVIGNHIGWWDPLLALLLNHTLLPGRALLAPMHRTEIERFRFMRKLGIFGVDTDDRNSLDPMVAYIRSVFRDQPRTCLWITPQGAFADVRAPVRLRPGAAALAARYEQETGTRPRVICMAFEYVFWADQRPEALLRFVEVTPQLPSTTGWQRAMTGAMTDNLAALAQLAVARDPAAFRVVAGAEGPRIHPVYDLLLRITGRRRALGEARRTTSENTARDTSGPKAEPAA